MRRRSSTGLIFVTSSPSRKMRPPRRLDEPVDHPQRRGLAAPRRADEHADLAVVDIEAQLVDGDGAVRVPLGDLVEADQRTNESRGEISRPRLASARNGPREQRRPLAVVGLDRPQHGSDLVVTARARDPRRVRGGVRAVDLDPTRHRGGTLALALRAGPGRHRHALHDPCRSRRSRCCFRSQGCRGPLR